MLFMYLYTGDKEKTDMAVIEVEMVTGWEAYNPDYLLNEVTELCATTCHLKVFLCLVLLLGI
jgi:hypothetical protein